MKRVGKVLKKKILPNIQNKPRLALYFHFCFRFISELFGNLHPTSIIYISSIDKSWTFDPNRGSPKMVNYTFLYLR